MQRSKFEEFLDENNDIREAAGKCANDFLGKDASEKAKENVTKTYTYSLKRPKNDWGISQSELMRVFYGKNSEWKKALTKRQNEYLRKSNVGNTLKGESVKLRDRLSRLLNYSGSPENFRREAEAYDRDVKMIRKRSGEINDRANVGIQWQLMKEYAKKYGWSLTRKKTS